MREPQKARRTDREAGEDGLAMIRGPVRRALAQFPKLGGETVIHAEGFREFQCHVFAMRAARAQVHFLEDTEVWTRFPDCGHDAFEVLAAIDIPVEDSRARVGRDARRKASSVDNFE